MKLGLGLYRHHLTPENYRFARQAGATHVVIHLVDYFARGKTNKPGDQPIGGDDGWGVAGDPGKLWTADELTAIRREIEAHGLKLEAVENFDPAHWHDVLLDGPLRERHIENCKAIVRALGEADIPVMGYNFSIAGVASRISGAFARGGAYSTGVDGISQTPLPLGMVWNMIVDENAPAGTLPPVTHEQLWDRYARFLRELLPVAEEAGVRLALHPDDPPAEFVRGTPRLVCQPRYYDKVLEISGSPANAFEYCLGSLQEMTEGGELYDATARHAAAGRIAYVHCRNVRGTVPGYRETFIDEGDLDVPRILRILRDSGFDGMIIPDHAPQMSCAAPWHAGMAYTLGYLRGVLDTLG